MTNPNEDLPDYRLVPLSDGDLGAVLRIFNGHIGGGFAAYPEQPVSEKAMPALLREASGYPTIAVKAANDQLLGFGFLRPYFQAPTFSHTAQATYFIDAAFVRKGIGTAILHHLEKAARKQGITKILAHISSRNSDSIAFHARHGFVECGRFPGIGRKWGVPFDVVWMIKHL